jgi:hypothetical protein
MGDPSLSEAFLARRDELRLLLQRDRSPRTAAQLLSHHLDRLADEQAQTAQAREMIDAVRTALCHALAAVRVTPPRPKGALFSRLMRGLRTSPRPEVDVTRLLEATEFALEAVDRLLAEKEAAPRPWDRDEDLLELLHGLLAAGTRNNGELALSRIASVADQLRAQRGITTVSYDPADPDHDDRLFDFPDTLLPGDPGNTLVPALTCGSRVLRRGEVGTKLPSQRRKEH